MNRLFSSLLIKQQPNKIRLIRCIADSASKAPLFTNQMKESINNRFSERNLVSNSNKIPITNQSAASKQISNNFEEFAAKMNKESDERKKFRLLIQEKQNLMNKFRHRDLTLEGGISLIEELYKLDAPFTNRDVETITNYLLENKQWELMLKLYPRITQAQLYSQFGYNFLIAFAELNMENECHELLLSIIKQYNVIDKKACNSLFSMYLRQNDITGLYSIYNEITRNNIYLKLNQYQLSSVSCELINSLYKYKHYNFVIEKYNEYDRNGITFDANSMNSVLCSYYYLHHFVDCLRIYHEMTLSKFTPNLESYYNIINILENGYIWDKVYYEIKNVEMLINNRNNNHNHNHNITKEVESDYFRDITIILKNHAFAILKKGISDNIIILNSKIHSNIDKVNISNIPKGVCRTVFRYILYRNYKRLYNVGNHSLCSLCISSNSDNIVEIERMILEYSFFPLRFRYDPKNNEIFINKADLHDFFEYVNNSGIWLIQESLSKKAAHELIVIAEESIKLNGRFVLAIAGGSLPKILASGLDPHYNYEKWYVFFVDERCVNLNDQDSNYNLFMKTLQPIMKLPEDHIFPIKYNEDPKVIAQDYETDLLKYFGKTSEYPIFDIILLGMGEDGHIASLFPNHKFLEYKSFITAVFNSPKLPPSRISFTMQLILNARYIRLIVTGSGKSAVLKKIFKEKDLSRAPTHLNLKHSNVKWYLDDAAASEIRDMENA